MTKKFEIVYRDPADLIPYEMNAKKHDEQQIRDLAAAIKKRGFDQPITVDKNDVIITGHGRREAAIFAGLERVPVIVRDDLSDDEVRAKRLEDNRLASIDYDAIKLSNFAGTVSAEVQANDDLVGCRIIRKMTLARFLDAVNFKDGNPTADPNQHFPDEMWFIEQKTLETHQVVEFELSSVFDLMGVQLPYRQIIKNTCPWKYRGPECGYTGPYFDKNNQQTSMSGAD
ncbi:phage minor tail protein L [Escherichia coli]|uniref:phage minor tail protein L n=1 Tax=Escherichia coli TaxID=562 RepID=UPI001D205285|nr:phage minor tail protein L [Escherichia coli]EFO4448527.1 phage minor tail protein L [Escherichia coli]MCH8576443.1 phage minor tail protein L [Escherichia coli]